MKLTPGVNFTHILRTAFTRTDLKITKYTVKLSVIFALSGSTGVKAARKIMVKLNPVGKERRPPPPRRGLS